MKKVLILSVALFLGIGATAQVKFGAKAGVNVATLTEPDGASFGTKVGFFVGGNVNFSFSEIIGLQPELVFSTQGTKEDDASINFNYLNIPVLLDIKPFANFSILVGPQIGINVYKGSKLGDESISGSDFEDAFGKVNTIDFAAALGAQYAIGGHFVISARYNLGLTKTLKDAEEGCANSVFQFGVGWTF
jgi:hypothetical protein